jgi:streptogramin lyase
MEHTLIRRCGFAQYLLAATLLLGGAHAATAQAITEYPTPSASSRPNTIASGPDGALWFTEYFADQIGRIGTDGTVTEFGGLSAASLPYGIVAGPDGALWFTENAGNAIGRITTSGTVSEFAVPTTTSGLTTITAGPDGALWFIETIGNNIGRITTGGAISEFPLPAAASLPNGIAAGSDGALWFAELQGNKIGRITTAGAITEFVVPTPASFPNSIVAGPDGALWFTEFNGGKVGQITTDGAVTEFPVPTAQSNPARITAGPDGALWFAEGAGNIIGRITTTGTISEFAIPTGGSAPDGIAAGPDGAMWFVEYQADKIGRIAVTDNSAAALVAAILPLSRSVEVGAAATAFATIFNAGPGAGTACAITPETSIPESFLYQTTNPTTNALTGSPNTPVDIPAGTGQSFVISATPGAVFPATTIDFTFGCTNTNPAPTLVGVDTLTLSASATAVPDIVALVASSDPGYLDIPGTMGAGAFAVATANLGAPAQITAAARTGTTTLPITLAICETNPATGACLAAPAASAITEIASGATPTFSIFAAGSGTIADAPGTNRVFVTFTDAGGALRGATSVAVRTE